jgi:hypothetical protein
MYHPSDRWGIRAWLLSLYLKGANHVGHINVYGRMMCFGVLKEQVVRFAPDSTVSG